jgi:hypothetical protein
VCTRASPGSIVGNDPGDEGGLTKGRLAAFLIALAGSAVLGIVAGLIWAAVAPRPLLQEIAGGEAELVNVESTAFIVADAWFVLIAAVGGLISGVLGYRILVRRAGPAAAAGLVFGAVAAALLALWVGENIGLGTYNHLLASSPAGTSFQASLTLGAKSTLAFWPLCTSGAILLAETGSRRSGQASARSGHRKTPGGPDDPGTSAMRTGEAQ